MDTTYMSSLMNKPKALLAALAAAVLALTQDVGLSTAHADPTTPPPPPGNQYQIPGPAGPQFPGAQVYPPICGTNPLACAFHFDPDTQTWQPPAGADQ